MALPAVVAMPAAIVVATVMATVVAAVIVGKGRCRGDQGKSGKRGTQHHLHRISPGRSSCRKSLRPIDDWKI
jgi:hypothetical protein